MTEVEKSKLTQNFLQVVSQHLSSRVECRGLTYILSIHPDMYTNEDKIEFLPNISVFPDIHHRKDTDKVSVIYHVASQHFGDTLKSRRSQSSTFIVSGQLVPGLYEYQPSIDCKKRRWVRIESL